MIEVFKGDAFHVPVRLRLNDGTYMALAGKTLYFTAKSSLKDSDANAFIKKTFSTILTDSKGDYIMVDLSESDLNVVGNYVSQITISDGSGPVSSREVKLVIKPRTRFSIP